MVSTKHESSSTFLVACDKAQASGEGRRCWAGLLPLIGVGSGKGLLDRRRAQGPGGPAADPTPPAAAGGAARAGLAAVCCALPAAPVAQAQAQCRITLRDA